MKEEEDRNEALEYIHDLALDLVDALEKRPAAELRDSLLHIVFTARHGCYQARTKLELYKTGNN